jgi:hypothetical protein
MTDYRTIRAAAVQISPDLDSLAGSVDRVVAAIAEAASRAPNSSCSLRHSFPGIRTSQSPMARP